MKFREFLIGVLAGVVACGVFAGIGKAQHWFVLFPAQGQIVSPAPNSSIGPAPTLVGTILRPHADKKYWVAIEDPNSHGKAGDSECAYAPLLAELSGNTWEAQYHSGVVNMKYGNRQLVLLLLETGGDGQHNLLALKPKACHPMPIAGVRVVAHTVVDCCSEAAGTAGVTLGAPVPATTSATPVTVSTGSGSLSQREAQMQLREAKVSRRENAVNAEESKLSQDEAAVQLREQNADKREAKDAAGEARLSGDEQQTSEREAAVTVREQKASATEKSLELREQKVEKREQAVTIREQKVVAAGG